MLKLAFELLVVVAGAAALLEQRLHDVEVGVGRRDARDGRPARRGADQAAQERRRVFAQERGAVREIAAVVARDRHEREHHDAGREPHRARAAAA